MDADDLIVGKGDARLQLRGLNGFRFPLSLVQIVDHHPVVAVFLLQTLGGVQGHNIPVGDERHPVAQQVGVHHVVGSDEHGRPLFALLFDNPSEQHRAGGVQTAGGLVQEQQPGVAYQGPRHAHPLAHPLGVGGHRLFQKVQLKLQLVQQLPHVPPLLLGVERGEILQIVHGAQIGIQIGELKENADLLKELRAVDSGDVLPEQGDFAAVALQDPGEDLLGGGLPGAVWPQEAEDFPIFYGEVQAVEGLLILAVGERQVFDLNHLPRPTFPAGFFPAPAGACSTTS